MFIHYFTSFYKLQQVRKILFYTQIGFNLLKTFAKNKSNPVRVEKKKRHIKITFTHGNTNKTLLVPSHHEITMKRFRYKYYLITDSERSLIQVSPEFPILVSANDLGGNSIEVTDLFDKVIKSYPNKEIPEF